jgi:rhodanese-related sulfurtransferase
VYTVYLMVSSMAASANPPTITELSPAEFVETATPPRLLDVRSGLEYAMFHAPQATNLSLQRILLGQIGLLHNWVLPQWFRELPKDEPIAVVCLTAHRSPIAAQAMAKLGFSQLFNISGGMMAWKEAGLPTTQNRQ